MSDNFWNSESYLNIDPTPFTTDRNAFEFNQAVSNQPITTSQDWGAAEQSVMTSLFVDTDNQDVDAWFDSATSMISNTADWLQDHEAVAGLIGGAAAGYMEEQRYQDSRDLTQQKLTSEEARWRAMEQYEAQRAAAAETAAAAAMMQAETARMREENDEQQRQRHNAGIRNFGARYGK